VVEVAPTALLILLDIINNTKDQVLAMELQELVAVAADLDIQDRILTAQAAVEVLV
jgi:hypothetical protein